MEKEKILNEVHPLIVSSIIKYAKDKDDFEDLYQEGVIKVLDLLSEFDSDKGANLFYYLKLYLKLFYQNYGRYGKKVVSLNILTNEGLELGDLIADKGLGVEETVMVKLARERVRQTISRLPKEERYIIEELYAKDRTLDELAKELGISRTSLFRKKTAILKHLRCIIAEIIE